MLRVARHYGAQVAAAELVFSPSEIAARLDIPAPSAAPSLYCCPHRIRRWRGRDSAHPGGSSLHKSASLECTGASCIFATAVGHFQNGLALWPIAQPDTAPNFVIPWAWTR